MKRKILSFVAFLTLIACPIHAQLSITVGNGTSSTTFGPVASWYESSATESIYKGDEINAIGQITKIAYQKKSGASTTQPNVKIYMKTTTNSIVSTDYTIGNDGFAGYTLVFQGELPNNSTTGWMEVPLIAPFNFSDRSKNLSILVTGSTCIDSGRPQYAFTTTSGGKMSSGYNDGTIGCGGNNPWTALSTMKPVWERPNIRLAINGTMGSGEFEADNSLIVYNVNGILNISSANVQIKNVQVFDISGRAIYSQNNIGANQLEINSLKATNELLVVKITDIDNRIINKKVIY